MKKINVTFEMAKGFANEITSKREKLASKKGFHLANIMVNAKFGKTDLDGTYEHINVSWEFFYPFSSVVAKKRRSKIYFNENACCAVPAKVLLYEITKGVEEIENVVELYKNGEFCLVENSYPTFKETVEKYGVEWFEKRIAEFFAYVANLEKVEVESNVENAEIINTPMLDEQEQDMECFMEQFNVSDEMRVNRIVKIVNDNWVKNAVEESVKLDWSLFDEQDMELMFENNDFAKMVYDRVCESNEYFSECLAYDDCFYVWLTKNVSCILVDFIYNLDSRPAWVNRNDYNFKDCGDYLDIVMFGSHKIGLYYDPSDSNADFACAENGGAYGKADMEYAVEIMENRDMILALAEKARIVKPSVEEIIENALESAIDSGEEYYDNAICQIGDWYVNYTSPCEEFPEGCVLVVDSEGRMYGNWCDLSDSGFAVEYLVNTIEMCNKEFNKVA